MKKGVLPALVASLAVLAPTAATADAAPLERFVELASQGPRHAGGDSRDISGSAPIVSDDGRQVLFETAEALVAEDGDTETDVYARSGGVTKLLSGGRTNQQAELIDASPDGGIPFFESEEQLMPADGDDDIDVYRNAGNGIELVSTSPLQGGADSENAYFERASAGGTVIFHTREPLTSADGDLADDLYRIDFRPGGPVTELVSDGSQAGGTDSRPSEVVDSSDDGAVIFFATSEPLEPQDNDADQDIYRRAGGTTTLVSHPPGFGGGPSSAGVGFTYGAGISADGLAIEFFSVERLSPLDTDDDVDVYRGFAGGAVLVSDGPGQGGGDSAAAGSSAPPVDGRHWFTTSESLSAEDTDTLPDVYERFGSATTLVSTGPRAGGADSSRVNFSALTADGGRRVFFATEEPLTDEDTDDTWDWYERSNGRTTLVSTGPRAGGADSGEAYVTHVSSDGTRAFITTEEPLTDDDTDSERDLYERADGETRLLSTGPRDGGADSQAALVEDVTPDGRFATFTTREQLVDADPDGELDAYLVGPAFPPPADPQPGAGAAATQPPTPVATDRRLPRDASAPLVGRLSLGARRFHLGSRLPSISRLRVGTQLSFQLSERARVELRFERRRRGRWTRVRGTIRRRAKAGANRLRFSGRLTRRRSLAPGSLRLVLTATDAAGNRSKPRRIAFTLLPPL